jgi:hypothetical protein
MEEVLYTRTLKRDTVLQRIVTAGRLFRPYRQQPAIPGVMARKLVKPLGFRYLKLLRRRRPPLAARARGATVMPHNHAQLRNR